MWELNSRRRRQIMCVGGGGGGDAPHPKKWGSCVGNGVLFTRAAPSNPTISPGPQKGMTFGRRKERGGEGVGFSPLPLCMCCWCCPFKLSRCFFILFFPPSPSPLPSPRWLRAWHAKYEMREKRRRILGNATTATRRRERNGLMRQRRGGLF